MNIRSTRFDNLSPEEIAAWSDIQRDEPTFVSPFFRPEFTQAVAAVRNNVEVAVLEDEDRPVGFFPYERMPRNRGLPVGTRLSDFHGVIAPRQVIVDPVEIVRACGLKSWQFDHLVSSRPSFATCSFRCADSPFIDLSRGFGAYESTLPTRLQSQLRRKQSRLEREVGPLRFESNVRDPSTLSTLVDWKVQQYERTGALNILGFPWIRDLLELMRELDGHDFAVQVSALYAGDKLVAVAYLLRSSQVLHTWFSSYNREMAKYSPGMQMKLNILSDAASSGISRFDLGKGPEDYKQILQSGAVQLAEGTVDPTPLKAGIRSAWWTVREGLRATPLRALLKRPARLVYDVQGWLALK